MTDAAAAEVGKNRGDVTSVMIVQDPVPEGVTLGAGWHTLVRVELKDGSTHDARLCGGIPSGPACSDHPRLDAGSAVNGGYRDIPACGSDPDKPEPCNTPLPTPDPVVVQAASAVEVHSLSIPIHRLGKQMVIAGEGSLANGIWNAGEFEFDEAWPDDVALRDGIVHIMVRSLEPDGKPFDNHYLHGWRPGVERIQAVLTFDVLWFEPGATLEIRNIVVR